MDTKHGERASARQVLGAGLAVALAVGVAGGARAHARREAPRAALDTALSGAQRQAGGARYRVHMWVVITGSNDGAFDNTLECHGSMRVNGVPWWEIPRGEADAHKRERNHVLELSADPRQGHFRRARADRFIFHDRGQPLALDLRVLDKDKGSRDDAVGLFNRTIDIAALARGGELRFEWGNRRNEASRLHIRAERIN